MKTHYTLAVTLVAGIAIGAFGVKSIQAQSKPPGYIVVELEITDPAGFKSYGDAARALPSTGGTFIVQRSKGIALAGERPKLITIVKFPSVDDAVAFDASPGYAALKAVRDKSSNWRSYAVEGLTN